MRSRSSKIAFSRPCVEEAVAFFERHWEESFAYGKLLVGDYEPLDDGQVDAIATAPINKASFAAAGLPWKGHTDLLAHLTGDGTRARLHLLSFGARGGRRPGAGAPAPGITRIRLNASAIFTHGNFLEFPCYQLQVNSRDTWGLMLMGPLSRMMTKW